MISSTVRLQLLAFVVVTVLGVGYVSVRYLDAGALLGTGPYPVTLQLTDSGGIFTGADAAVTNLSAIGEQFVDLRLVRADGPKLAAGSVIPASRVSTPVAVEDLVANLDNFVRSVPLDSLRTVVDELGTGFTGTGPELQTLLDSTDAFTRDALAALPQTLTLIRDGRVVLQTQNEQSSAITSFSRDLALLAAQLRSSDPDLRRLIRTAPQFAAQTSGLIQDSGNQIGQLLADLLTVSRVPLPRQAALRQLLSVYPVVAAATDSSVVPNDGFAHLGLVLNFFDPYACVRGYEGTIRRPGTDTAPIPANRDAFCAEPPGSPTGARRAERAARRGSGSGRAWRVRPASSAAGALRQAAPHTDHEPRIDPGGLNLAHPCRVLDAERAYQGSNSSVLHPERVKDGHGRGARRGCRRVGRGVLVLGHPR